MAMGAYRCFGMSTAGCLWLLALTATCVFHFTGRKWCPKVHLNWQETSALVLRTSFLGSGLAAPMLHGWLDISSGPSTHKAWDTTAHSRLAATALLVFASGGPTLALVALALPLRLRSVGMRLSR